MKKVKIFVKIHDLNGKIPSIESEINSFLEDCNAELVQIDYSIQDSASDIALNKGYGSKPRIIEYATLIYR